MPILSLGIKNVRCIKNLTLKLHPNYTLVYGLNGSGKTSILESMYVLSYGRSFRTSSINKITRFHVEQFSISCSFLEEDNSVPLDLVLKKNKNSFIERKLAGESISRTNIAKMLPLVLINHDSFSFFTGGPEARRKFLLQSLFHVEPEFVSLWRAYSKVLNQRNSQLKSPRFSVDLVKAWDSELILLTNKIARYQRQFLVKYNNVFADFCMEFLPECEVKLTLLPGWEGEDFSKALSNSFALDKALGYTKLGSHRADIEVKVNDSLAADTLSRGQQKLFVAALNLGVANYIKRYRNKNSLVLVDDIGAELDKKALSKLFGWLGKTNLQTVITAVESETFLQALPKDNYSMFHVEQ